MLESLTEKLTNALRRFRSKGKLTEADVKEGMREVKLTLTVAPDDTGMVIGRHGKIAKAIRSVMKVAGNKDGKHVTVEIE